MAREQAAALQVALQRERALEAQRRELSMQVCSAALARGWAGLGAALRWARRLSSRFVPVGASSLPHDVENSA